MPDAASPEQPPQIPGYKVISKLGQGGMATVWRAEQSSLGRLVALKVVSPHLVSDQRSRDRFLREARAGARVVHPNVITCFDAGEHNGRLFMALELVTGGDLKGLLDRKGGRLDPWHALHLIRDCLAGLEAIESAGLIHRDIKPGNIFLSDKGQPKLADLGLARPSGGDAELTMPGMIVGTPAYIAPEQARAVPDIDIRADIYALGATLYHCITGSTPYPGDNPMTVLVQVLNDPVPDPAKRVPDLPAEVIWLVRTLMSKDRSERPATSSSAREMVDRVIAGSKAKPAAPPAPAAAVKQHTTSALRPTVAPVQTDQVRRADKNGKDVQPPSTSPATTAKVQAPRPHADIKIDQEQLKILAKRIIVDQNGLRASLALAPGASFPRWMLDQIITAAGVVHGVLDASIHAATFPKDIPRRLVLAKGTPPSPGIPGRSVRGDPLPAMDETVNITVTDDGMQAAAFTKPGHLAKREDLERMIKGKGLRFGLDQESLRRLIEGPPVAGGRVVIARGKPADKGRAPGFVLSGDVENTTVEAIAGANNLRKVNPGEQIARWDEGRPARSGMDVLGREIPPFAGENTTPESCTGEGTELSRDAEGNLILLSRVSGFCQRQVDGRVRVVGIFAVDGDLGPNHPPIVTDDVVVIRGSVKAGAKIQTTSDVVVMGDLEDATVSAGGHIQVEGKIAAGQPIAAAGTVQANGGENRAVMAGCLRINGEVRNCDLRATGDITVNKVIGGSLVAGGNLHLDVAGDGDGTTTELWAGHHLTYAEEAKLAQLAAANHDAERGRMMRERQAVEAELSRMQRSQDRMKGASFVNQAAAKRLAEQLQCLEDRCAQAAKADETARHKLARARGEVQKMAEKGENALARVEVGVVAHAGVIARLADATPEPLHEPRLKFKLGM